MKKIKRRKRKQNKIETSWAINKSLLKIIVVLLITGLNLTGLLAIGETISYYFDSEASNQNVYQAGVLDFDLTSPTTNFISSDIVSNIVPGDSVTREASVIRNGNPFQYNASVVKTSGDDDFCNALILEAELEGETKYSGGLMSFNLAPPIIIGEDGQDDWLFTVTLPIGENFPPDKVCEVKFVFDGWQINLPNSSSGFSDQEEIPSSFVTGGIKINKVYYDVDGNHGIEPDNEWIELYNPTDQDINLKDWEICNQDDCEVIDSQVTISSLGYALISHDIITWNYWNVPDDIPTINQLGGQFEMDNDADMLILKDPDENIIDQMNWGTPDLGWLNYNSDVWDPGAIDVAEGSTLGRSPNGYDTDQASDWEELVPPEVDLIYPDEGGNYTWYWTYDYNIQWIAINPNGDDADLGIDLSYIKDVNGDSQISEGDEKYDIAIGTENDGEELWTVPSGFLGYIWIELIATGPENPMLNSKTVSGDIWDPIPIYLWENDPQIVLEALQNPDDEGEGEVIHAEDIQFLAIEENHNEDTDINNVDVIEADDSVEEVEKIVEEPKSEESLEEELQIEEEPIEESISESEIELEKEINDENETEESNTQETIEEDSTENEQEQKEQQETEIEDTTDIETQDNSSQEDINTEEVVEEVIENTEENTDELIEAPEEESIEIITEEEPQIEEIVEEPVIEETQVIEEEPQIEEIVEEPVIEEIQVIEEEPQIEEIVEEPVIEETQVIEEEPTEEPVIEKVSLDNNSSDNSSSDIGTEE